MHKALLCGLLLSTFAYYGGAVVAAPPRDGELQLPAGYKAWPLTLSVQRPDLKQVRDIYVNAQASRPTQPFPYGTVLVMEIYSAKVTRDGRPALDAAGELQKGALTRIFVMGKGSGWGQDVAPELRTGEWVYASYESDGRSAAGDLNACRGCHALFKDWDFVALAAKYEAMRNTR
jgi:hypothetical protein